MPELPEVETTRRGIEKHLKDEAISQVIIRRSRLRWAIPHEITHYLPGLSFHSIQRRAKYLLLNTELGTLIIHLGMSGHLRIVSASEPVQKHDHVDIVLANHKILRYTDPRRFGAFLWTFKDPLTHSLLHKLGPEPLSRAFNARYLWSQAQARSIPSKLFLMDGKIVVGVGNIYANEALFAARVHPLTPANQLTSTQCKALVRAVKCILKKAIAAGGTTLKDFSSAEGKPGYFKQKLLVYGREGQNCLQCDSLLKKLIIGQRTTVYCPRCQI